MKNITIKSVTNCPTCNSECKVNNGTTQYYVPVKKYTEEDIRKAILLSATSDTDFIPDRCDEIINSLNKQNNE